MTMFGYNVHGFGSSSGATSTINLLYGGVITTDYDTTGLYGLEGDMTNGFRAATASTNYSDNTRTLKTSGYSGNQTGAGDAGGNEDGAFFMKAGGTAQTGVGLSVGWFTGRLFLPADHDTLAVELNAISFASNNSDLGEIDMSLVTSPDADAFKFEGTRVALLDQANNWSDGNDKTTGSRNITFDISSYVSTIASQSVHFTFYAFGGQFSDVSWELYRLASFNAERGLDN